VRESGKRSPFPEWLKKRVFFSARAARVRALLNQFHLETVCSNARCPNQAECFARGTATFMILGNTCTRNCAFCAVKKGKPSPPDPKEPERLAEAARLLGLRHVVVTSVTRDDLPDGGAGHFAATIRAIRGKLSASVEVLTPDFKGDNRALEIVIGAHPDVFNHNVETVPSLYSRVRPEADYLRSLDMLEKAKHLNGSVITKSGFMVGLGEKKEEVFQTMRDLRDRGVEMLTIGQYLSPTREHLPVVEFVHPEVFEDYARFGRNLGFSVVASGPFVRSSYLADKTLALRRGG